MYRNCIFCATALGTNDALPSMPSGKHIAVDAWRGRLWIVCPSCARWNLVPIEERWEPVEEAEKAFRDAKLRVQSENVGLAQLPDGTRLIRIGRAVEGEIAAWRYGRQLLDRRRRYLWYGGLAVAGLGGLYFGGILGGSSLWLGYMAVVDRLQQRVVGKVKDMRGEDVVIRRWHVDGIDVARDDDAMLLRVRDAHRKRAGWSGNVSASTDDIIAVRGDDAVRVLSRALVHVNTKGASNADVNTALRALTDAGSPSAVIDLAMTQRVALGRYAGTDANMVPKHLALAMEMAVNESSERRALEGELAQLEADWREAEEIASIADSLPFGLSRLLPRA